MGRTRRAGVGGILAGAALVAAVAYATGPGGATSPPEPQWGIASPSRGAADLAWARSRLPAELFWAVPESAGELIPVHALSPETDYGEVCFHGGCTRGGLQVWYGRRTDAVVKGHIVVRKERFISEEELFPNPADPDYQAFLAANPYFAAHPALLLDAYYSPYSHDVMLGGRRWRYTNTADFPPMPPGQARFLLHTYQLRVRLDDGDNLWVGVASVSPELARALAEAANAGLDQAPPGRIQGGPGLEAS